MGVSALVFHASGKKHKEKAASTHPLISLLFQKNDKQTTLKPPTTNTNTVVVDDTHKADLETDPKK